MPAPRKTSKPAKKLTVSRQVPLRRPAPPVKKAPLPVRKAPPPMVRPQIRPQMEPEVQKMIAEQVAAQLAAAMSKQSPAINGPASIEPAKPEKRNPMSEQAQVTPESDDSRPVLRREAVIDAIASATTVLAKLRVLAPGFEFNASLSDTKNVLRLLEALSPEDVASHATRLGPARTWFDHAIAERDSQTFEFVMPSGWPQLTTRRAPATSRGPSATHIVAEYVLLHPNASKNHIYEALKQEYPSTVHKKVKGEPKDVEFISRNTCDIHVTGWRYRLQEMVHANPACEIDLRAFLTQHFPGWHDFEAPTW